jgi:hypothetical protein
MIKKLALLVVLVVGMNSAEAKTYGAVMPKGKAVNIETVVANVAEYDGKKGKYSGRITQVCQAKGCWLTVESNGKAARIMTNDAFFVPKNSKGDVLVFGELKQVKMKTDMAKHLAEDAGKSEPLAPDEIHIIASSIKIK